MDDGIEKAFEIIDRNAEESGNRHAFMSGMVMGLAHGDGFILEAKSIAEARGMIHALLDLIDDRHFKVQEN